MFYFQKIIAAATMIIEIFVYKSEPVLPHYINQIECNNNSTIGKRCLDGNMDSVFFV
jgi:hypothetical protein